MLALASVNFSWYICRLGFAVVRARDQTFHGWRRPGTNPVFRKNAARRAIAGQCAFDISEVARVQVELHLSDADIRLRELERERLLDAAFLREAAQVSQRFADERLTRLRRSRQRRDTVVHVEEHRAREASEVVESPLHLARVPHAEHGVADERRDDDGRGRQRQAVAPRKARGAIDQRVRAGQHRAAVEIPLEILGQVRGRGIPPIGILAQCHLRDAREVSTQLPRQPRRCGLPRLGNGLRGGCIAARARAGQRIRHRQRVGLHDHLLQVRGAARLEPVRPAPAEQLVEQQAQRVDVGCR